MRRAALVVTVLVIGCEHSDPPIQPDAAADASGIDALPLGVPDFFGEACATPSALGVVNTCRDELPYPNAYCTPEGACRPFCGSVSISGGSTRACEDVGGTETWAFPTSSARVCYCTP